jgi:hypothetical protein
MVSPAREVPYRFRSLAVGLPVCSPRTSGRLNKPSRPSVFTGAIGSPPVTVQTLMQVKKAYDTQNLQFGILMRPQL